MASAETTVPNRFVTIGEIVKAIGLRGEIKLYPLLDYRDELLTAACLRWSDGTEVDVARHRPSGSCIALKVRGVDDRNAAEAMVGRKLGFMSRDYLDPAFPRLPGGLPFRWLGRTVRTTAGETVGEVVEVRLAGAGHVLVIPDPQDTGREILVPAVEPIMAPENDLVGDLVIDPPEGLFDVQRG